MKLQRQKAPAGGAIVNRTFFKGGRFMTRAFRSVRDVADALRQLSRRPQNKSEQIKRKIENYLTRYPKRGGFYRLLNTLGIEPDFKDGMTKKELLRIEEVTKVPQSKRLSKYKSIAKLDDDDRLIKAKLKTQDVYDFLTAVQKSTHSPSIIKVANSRTTPDNVRAILHGAILADENGLFIGHMGDPRKAGSEWYKSAMNPLDVAFHSSFAKSPQDEKWGNVDWSHPDGPRLKYGEQTAWEHAPHQVIAKAITAFTSGQRTPEDNGLTAEQIVAEAHRRYDRDPTKYKNWVEAIPLVQQEAFDKWFEHRDAIHPNTTDPDQLLRWADSPAIKNISQGGMRGWRGAEVVAVPVGEENPIWHVVAKKPVGGGEPVDFYGENGKELYDSAKERRLVTIPLVTKQGLLQPKKWSTQENVDTNIRDLWRLLKHNDGDIEKAAKWILTLHTYEELYKVLNDRSIDGFELYDKKGRGRTRKPNLGYLKEDVTNKPAKALIPGSWLFGPKFGPFLQNIHAHTPVPKGEPADYYSRWDTQDVHRVRGHEYRFAGKPSRGQPLDSARRAMFFAAQYAGPKTPIGTEQPSNIDVAGTQSIDWKATKSLPSLFGVDVEHKDYVNAANAILAKHNKQHLLMDEDGKLLKPHTTESAPAPDTPARLARVISYVGGDHVPGAQRAIGVWDGGAERSNVVETDPERAAALAAQNRQKSALWFEPGPGEDSLHVFTHPGTPAEARALLNKHGVTYATLVPGRRGTQVHVVDPGGEFDGVLPGRPQKGKATFRRL